MTEESKTMDLTPMYDMLQSLTDRKEAAVAKGPVRGKFKNGNLKPLTENQANTHEKVIAVINGKIETVVALIETYENAEI